MKGLKKVIFVANTRFTITNFRKELVDDFIDRGYEVVIACPKNCNFSIDSKVNEWFEARGVSHVDIDISRQSINPLNDIKLIFQLCRLFKEERPSIVLNYTIKPTIYASIAAKICSIKKIYSTVTGLGYLFTGNTFKIRLLQSIVRIQYFLAFKCNTLVFFQNVDDLEMCRSKGLLNGVKTTIVNGSGVNLVYFKPNGGVKKKYNFLLIARVLRDKGIQEYVDAIRLLRPKYPFLSFALLGPIDENPAAFSIDDVKMWENEGLIEYIPAQKDVRPYLELSEVFVLPSYREGTPRSVLEAMSMGLPIITTNAPGCKGTVNEGVNGFKVDIKSAQGLALAMEKFVLDRSLIKKMGQESSLIVKSKYDVNIINSSILKHIQ